MYDAIKFPVEFIFVENGGRTSASCGNYVKVKRVPRRQSRLQYSRFSLVARVNIAIEEKFVTYTSRWKHSYLQASVKPRSVKSRGARKKKEETSFRES